MEVFMGDDSELDNCLLKFCPQNTLLGQIWPRIFKVLFLNETHYMEVIKDADSEFDNIFFKFCPFFGWITF